MTNQSEINADQLSFETALHALETTVSQLEAGELTLEASLKLYERGQQLAAFCGKQLGEARLKVEQLSADGEIVTISS
ncbi:MAG: exodeoxyribonuclease VII small subunit [Candidatus Promineifilaceae bacterium]